MTEKQQKPTLSREYILLEQWWQQQYKVHIVDYDTKKTTIFAIELTENPIKKIFTKAKAHVGNCAYWIEKEIPSKFKNDDGIIIDPVSFCYLSKISLFPEMKSHHSLPKYNYLEYIYVKEYDILRKTHEVRFI